MNWTMGDYGVYVWSAYAIVLFGLAYLLFASLRSTKGMYQKIRDKLPTHPSKLS
ncbi:MAG: heme exporter protein CcmD [Candidatus Berkiellales bacterium]